MYLVQQFCGGEFRQSEAVAEFRFIVFFYEKGAIT